MVGGREGGRDTRVIVLLALPFGGTQVQTDASQGICPQPVPSCQSCQSSCSWTARAPRGLLSHAPHLHSFPVPRCDVTGAGDRRPVAMCCTHGPIYISIYICPCCTCLHGESALTSWLLGSRLTEVGKFRLVLTLSGPLCEEDVVPFQHVCIL